MHGAQRLRGMGEPQDLPEWRPDGRLGADPVFESRHIPLHAFLGIGRERQPMSSDELEEPQDQPRVGFKTQRRAEKHRAMKHREIGIRKLCRPIAELRKQRTAFGFESIHPPVGKARNVPHRAIVLPHQSLGRNRAIQGRNFILTFEAELVVVAPSQIVEKAANLEEHRHSGGKIVIARAQFREPAEHLEIAESAGRIFDIGLQMIDGALEFCVPLVGQLHDVAAEVGTRVANLTEQRFVAREQTAIEQTDRQLGIRSNRSGCNPPACARTG